MVWEAPSGLPLAVARGHPASTARSVALASRGRTPSAQWNVGMYSTAWGRMGLSLKLKRS